MRGGFGGEERGVGFDRKENLGLRKVKFGLRERGVCVEESGGKR